METGLCPPPAVLHAAWDLKFGAGPAIILPPSMAERIAVGGGIRQSA